LAQNNGQAETEENYIERLFKAETPLSTADIDFFVFALPYFKTEKAKENILEIARWHGISENRAGVIMVKMSLGISLLQEPSSRAELSEKFGSEIYLPTAEEMLLIVNNKKRIVEAIRESERR
jgi:hypothetical protein